MSNGHVCDECKRAAPIGEAIFWWSLESIEGVIAVDEKGEYHFCSWECIAIYSHRVAGRKIGR